MAATIRSIAELLRGLKTFLRGLSWLKKHPVMLMTLFLPALLSVTLIFLGWGVFAYYSDQVFSWVLFSRPESWWWLPFYYLAKAVLWIGVLALGFVSFSLFVNVLSSPFYDYVSSVVEKDLSGETLYSLSLWESLSLMGEELKKVLFILTISLLLFLIPGVNVISPLITAILLGWEFYDYPLARRGWTFRQRTGYMFQHLWSVMGLGLWLLIPGLQLLFFPLAVVGGTILAVEDLQKSKHT